MPRRTVKPKLTEFQKKFIREFIQNPVGIQAYITARAPKTVSYETARVEASRLLTNPAVKREIEAAGKALFNVAKLKGVNVVRGLKKIAFADPIDLIEKDAKGNEQLRSIRNIPYKARLALASIKAKVVSVKKLGTGTVEEVQKTTTIVEYKLNDRVAALDKLMKYMGKYEKDNRQKQPKTESEMQAMKDRLKSRGVDLDVITRPSAN